MEWTRGIRYFTWDEAFEVEKRRVANLEKLFFTNPTTNFPSQFYLLIRPVLEIIFEVLV